MTDPNPMDELETCPFGALNALRNAQQQLDGDGVIVGVSRQALDELLAAYDTLRTPPAPNTELLERVAQALHEHEDSWNDVAWEHLPPGTQELFRGQAAAAIAALSPSQQTDERVREAG